MFAQDKKRLALAFYVSMNREKEYKNYIHLKGDLGLRRLNQACGPTKIVFFPFVGGQSLAFKPLAHALPRDWQLWAVDPPGHGWAGGEFVGDFSELVDLYFRELQFLWQGDFYLFGHSLGGLFAYRLAQVMQAAEMKPRAVFIGASPVPHRIDEYEYLRRQSKEELIDTMIAIGGIPGNIARQRDFLLFYAKQIEADLPVFLDCKISREPLVSTPMMILYSKHDLFLPYENIFEWDIYGRDVSFAEVAGNHLFIQDHPQAVAQKMSAFVEESGGGACK